MQEEGQAIIAQGATPNRLRAVLYEIDFALLVEHVSQEKWAACEQQIAAAAQAVRAAGADFLVVTSNTGATLAGRAREETTLPLLDIVSITVAELKAATCRCAGLMSTGRTDRSGVYHRAAAAAGINIVSPPPELAEAIQEIIVKELIHGRVSASGLATVSAVAAYFASKGVDSLVLGCTDMTHLAIN